VKDEQKQKRREAKIRNDTWAEAYKAGYEAGQRELRQKFRELMDVERAGEASRHSDWGWG
jgi:flagellar biosynthesis/type III secretory pathway protein FliH